VRETHRQRQRYGRGRRRQEGTAAATGSLRVRGSIAALALTTPAMAADELVAVCMSAQVPGSLMPSIHEFPAPRLLLHLVCFNLDLYQACAVVHNSFDSGSRRGDFIYFLLFLLFCKKKREKKRKIILLQSNETVVAN
jgi:hypothetical protein